MLTHRRSWLVGAIALMVLLGVLWASSDRPVDVPAAPSAFATPRTAAADGSRGSPAAAAAPDTPERLRAQRPLGGTIDGAPLELLVLVRFPDERPAAGAEVWYWGPRSEAQRARDRDAKDRASDAEVALRASGKVAITDAQGQVAIATETVGVICARLGRFYAEVNLALLASTPAELQLRLAEDLTLRALVVDGEGQPREGIEIEAEVQFRSRRLGSESETHTMGRTDAQGLVTLPHAQLEVSAPSPEFVTWQMRLRCVQKEISLEEREVGAAEVTSPAPIRLVVRTGGTIVARVVDADDALWWQYGSTFLEGDGAADRLLPSQSSTSLAQYTFRQVPLGQQWQLHSGGYSTPVVGPVRSNEVVEVRLQVPVRQWELVGRLVRSDGEHLAEAAVALIGPDPVPRLKTTCGRDGELRYWWSLPSAVESLAGVVLEVSHELVVGKAQLALGVALRPGRTELGDLVVPVPADEVLLASVELRCEGKVLAGGRARLLLRGEGDESCFPVVAKRQGDALFLRGRPRQGQMELVCSHPHCLESPRTAIEVGEHRVVELRCAASLEVQVDAPTIPQALIWGELRPVDGRARWMESGGPTFSWSTLKPGCYTLRIGAKDRVLYEVAAIVLGAGRNQWPSDGAPIDLRSVPGAIRLDVRSADRHEAIAAFHSYVVPAGATWVEGADVPDAESQGDWFVPHREPMDVLITAKGFVPVRLANPTMDTLVELQRCTTLRMGGAAVGKGKVVRLSIVRHAVVDSLLRAADRSAQYEPFEEENADEPFELLYAPGTIVEVVVERDGVAGAAQRVVVGAVSPQEVVVR